jgi:hypothetical protein
VNAPWWAAFGPAEAPLSCGDGTHRLRWADGILHAVDHPDAEGELVLAALGGDTSPCLDLVRAWSQHSDDLTVLAVGPRSASDPVTIPAAILDELSSLSDPAGQGQHLGLVHFGRGGPVARRGMSSSGGGVVTASYTFSSAKAGPTPRPIPARVLRQAALRRARSRGRSGGWTGYRPLRGRGMGMFGWPGTDVDQAKLELIRLLALGAPFQFRLSAAVAHAWSAGGEHGSRAEKAGPALTAALAGRLAPAAAQWLHIDPDEVEVGLRDGPGWGEITRIKGEGNARLLARLPVGWLADVWAPGFAVIDSHLVLAVLQADWPRASVLALRSPGREPTQLEIRQDQGHWSATSR